MGVMKAIATKKVEGSATPAEKKIAETIDEAQKASYLLPLPAIEKVGGTGPDVLVLAWPAEVLKKVKKHKELYFFCWSHNWASYTDFHPDVELIDLEDVYSHFHKDEKVKTIKVVVEGPYDVDAFDKGYLPFSPYQSMEQAQAVQRLSQDSHPTATYLWRAVLV